jgi:hypothetical protein
MNAATLLLTDLQSHGVTATVNGDRLKLNGPTEVLTPDVLAEIRSLKPAIIQLLSTPSEPRQPEPADAQSTLHLAESAEAERTARIRAMAQLVEPEELLKVRRRLSPAIRRNSSADEINEMLLCQCLLDKGIEPYSVLYSDGERIPNGNDDQQPIAEVNA